jgi:hypothetical protein
MTIFLMDNCGQLKVAPLNAKEHQHKLEEVTIFIALERRPPQMLTLNSSELEA